MLKELVQPVMETTLKWIDSKKAQKEAAMNW